MNLIYLIFTGLFPEESREALDQAVDLIVRILVHSL